MSRTLSHFLEISRHPRPSGQESAIREYLIGWAKQSGYEYETDAIGNLFAYVPAKNSASIEPVILQSHMDMVCVKIPESSHDFLTDPIRIVEKEGFLHADGTTLGADNGIGVALSMAACGFDSHPPLELVFTVDEEAGMSGVQNLDFSLLSARRVINLDSENDDEICISSAGGARFIATKPIMRAGARKFPTYSLSVSGMQWGHSGCEIHENRGNAVMALATFLLNARTETEIIDMRWGVAFNVIPSKAWATVGVSNEEAFRNELDIWISSMKTQFDCPNIVYSLDIYETDAFPVSDMASSLRAIVSAKTGVYAMSEKIPDLVETSMNLGMISFEWNALSCIYLARSSINSEVVRLFDSTRHLLSAGGFESEMDGVYFGWQDDPNSELLRIAKEEIERTMGCSPKITAIHAGLECGNMVAGLGAGVNAISIGPNVYDVHSVNERVEIASIARSEESLRGMLARL